MQCKYPYKTSWCYHRQEVMIVVTLVRSSMYKLVFNSKERLYCSGTICVKFLPKGQGWPRYQIAWKYCRKFQSSE